MSSGRQQAPENGIRAVIFDLGGVVLESPLRFLQDFERRRGFEPGLIARLVGGYGLGDGSWQRLERGELSLEKFCMAFDRDLRAAGATVPATEMMRELARSATVRPGMVGAIRALRQAGLKVAALTNNWVTDTEQDRWLDALRAEFHEFVESCRVGMRKPEPRIYELTCQRLQIEPQEAVFLDDIGSNLKAARQLGMTTIKVAGPEAALSELERVVGFPLRGSAT